MDYTETKFSFYPANIKVTKPLGELSLSQFVRSVKTPKEEVKNAFIDIREAVSKGDLKLKAELKQKLFYFTPCIRTNGEGRKYSDIVSFTGLMQVDFDNINNAPDFRDWFFDNYRSCTVCGVSSSGRGIKALVRIPIVNDVDSYKEYFYGFSAEVEDLVGLDHAPQNPSLPLFIFYDPNTRSRDDAEVWTKRGAKVNAFQPFSGQIEVLEDVAPWKKQRVTDIFKRGVERIVDNAHPQILSWGTTIGGYVSAGYLSEDEAEILIEEYIYANDYMSKDHESYIRTAKTLMQRGMSSPLYLKEDEQ